MPAFNILDFGAAGDGESNDGPAIQRAINACHTAGGGTVLVPAGKRYLSGTLTLRSNTESWAQ
jgi:polygalacturonase